jgi:glycosyltransferase involved in cell wall biosynthesis
MKVLTVTHSWPNTHNNTKGNFVEDETALLSTDTNQRVLFLQSLDPKGARNGKALPSSQNIPISSCNYLSLPKKLFPTLTARSIARQIVKEATSFEADIIHIHFLFPVGISVPYFPKELAKKTVITIHGNEWFTLKDHSVFKHYLPALTACSSIICVSDELKADLIDYYPELSDKVTAIPHGVNTDIFKIKTAKRHYDFISVGGISPVKGHDLTLKAIASNPKLREFSFSIIGNLVDKQYYKKLLKIVDDENLTNVSFLPTIHRDEMADLYNQCSTFVLPSRYEGFGISFIEAAACGCSLIGPNSGGPASIINKDVGDKVDVGDIKKLSNLLVLHSRHTFNRQSIHDSIAKRFSLESKKRKQIQLYHNILSVS